MRFAVGVQLRSLVLLRLFDPGGRVRNLGAQKIKQLPDVLTGQRLANVGIGLGLIFGLASATYGSVQYFIQHRQASLFATKYADVLKAADMGELLWYNSTPDMRKGKTAPSSSTSWNPSRKRSG